MIEPAHNPLPDINSSYMSANYDAGSGVLTVTGYADHYGDLSGPHIDDGWFSLSAKLTQSSATPMNVSEGALSIDGTVVGGPSGSLLTGTVDNIGAQLVAADQYAVLDFTFHVTGGALASDFGATGGTTLTLHYTPSDDDTEFSGSFADSFSYGLPGGEGANTADTFSTVPEPGSATVTLVLTAAGLAASVLRRSRMRRK